jgi:4-amino-4-deoxy-L-arabinose transferase-like glycosyltransferase
MLNFWQLDRLGYANSYYAAAVKSMLQSWHNFFFVSFDPGGFVSIDKPPLGFWIQTVSAKIFGYSGTSLLAPEALAGVLSVAVLYRLIARVWGRGAGLLAALFLAVTPVSVITSRNNTIDSLLVLTVLLGAWAVSRAAESGRLRWLLLSATLVGLGFNIKMLEAYLVVPAFGLVYLLGARASWRKRISHLAIAVVTLLVVSLSWAVAVDLTPASARPYVGSSGTNSAVNLALGYNGLQRLSGGAGMPGGGGGGNALFNGGPASVFRLLGTTLGGQVSWLLILAVLGLIVAAVSVPWRRLDDRGRSLMLWGSWLLVAGAFFSVAEFFHPYYTVMLAPAIAALAGIGVTTLWRAYRETGWRGWLLPAVLLATAGVQAYILRDYPAWNRWLTPVVVGACLLAALALVGARLRSRRMAWGTTIAVGLAVASLLAAPTTWAAYSVVNGTNSTIPTAGPSAQSSSGFGSQGGSSGQGGFGGSMGSGTPPQFSSAAGAPSGAPSGAQTTGSGMSRSTAGGPSMIGSAAGVGRSTARVGGAGGNQVDAALLRYLEAHQGSARYLVATSSSGSASSLIIATGKPVMALGGFSGNDAILTTAQLAQLVASGKVHYFLIQSGGMGGNSTLMQWVQAHGKLVPTSQYETSSSATTGGFSQASTLYYVSSSAAKSK